MNKTKILIKTLSIFLLISFASINTSSAQSSEENVEVKEKAKTKILRIAGDPGKGMFWVHYRLEKDAKKVQWKVYDEEGTVLIKTKYKKVKAGEHKFTYNYLHGPDGLHTHKLFADGVEIASIEVLKKK